MIGIAIAGALVLFALLVQVWKHRTLSPTTTIAGEDGSALPAAAGEEEALPPGAPVALVVLATVAMVAGAPRVAADIGRHAHTASAAVLAEDLHRSGHREGGVPAGRAAPAGFGARDLDEYIRTRNESATNRTVAEFRQALQQAATPGDILAVVAGARRLGHTQVVTAHDTYGSDMTPAFKAALARATTDREVLKEFVKGLHVKVGPTGVTENDFELTDQVRRKLAYSAGLGADEVAGLFEPTPARLTPAEVARGLLERVQNPGYGAQEEARDMLLRMARGDRGLPLLNRGGVGIEYRHPSEYTLTPEQVRSLFPDGVPPIIRATPYPAP